MFSIKTKLIFSYTLVFALLIIGYSMYIYQSMRNAAIETLDTRLESFAERFEAELEELLHDKQIIDLNDIISARKEIPAQFAIRLADSSGAIIFSDSVFLSSPPEYLLRRKNNFKFFEFLQLGLDHYRSSKIPLEINDSVHFLIQIAAPTTEIEASLSQLRWIFFITIPFAFLLSAIAAYIIIRIGFRPISMMIDSAQTISEKNLEQRLPVPNTNDEVKMLGDTFNTMIGRIDAAFQSQKRFIADASHEIRTPLTIIGSELEYAKRDLPDGAVKESIGISLREVDHLKHLTDDLLLLTKLDSLQTILNEKLFRLDELVLESVRKVKHLAAEKKITFDLQMESGIELRGDEEKIASVIIILLDNAVKYSFEGTVVTINLTIRTNNSPYLEIINKGIGFSDEELPSLFNRFYRGMGSRTEHQGNGLGLAIAYRIMELHRGAITVSSVKENETIFSVEFPVQM